MKIALVGTFDIPNYGDLLFPEITRAHLKGIAEVECFSPRGGPAVWRDTATTTDVDLLIDDEGVDAIILGGGNLVHARPWNHAWYDTGATRGYLAYPRMWFGASVAAASRGLPLCWNAPGAPTAFRPAEASLLRDALEIVDYLSVRDRPSARELRRAGVTSPVRVVPDPALEVAGLWTEDEIDATYRQLWHDESRSMPDLSIAVHLSERYVDEPLDVIADRLDTIAHRLGGTVLLLALGPCHGDHALARRIGGFMSSEPLVVAAPSGVRTLAAAIGRSGAYLGSSLHGAITAVASGVPSRIVCPGAAVSKFEGFAEQFPGQEILLSSWAEAEAAAVGLPSSGPDFSVRDAAAPLLDRHWCRVIDVITETGRTSRRHAPEPELSPRRLDDLLPSMLEHLGSEVGVLRRRLVDAEAAAYEAGSPAPAQPEEPPVLTRPRELPATREAAQRDRDCAPTNGPPRLSITVVCWDVGHNAFGRAHLLADMLAAEHDVEIVGSHFPEFGDEVWGPLRDTSITVRRYPGGRLPEYFGTMERMAAELTADVVYVVKPRLPALGVGFLAKCDAKRGLAVDCDDLELSFVGARGGLSLAEVKDRRSQPDFLRPQGSIWTGYCESAVQLADAITVSNVPLAARYGGSVIPHARDERVFDPDLYDRDEARARFGIEPHERVVLFAGTPRKHKASNTWRPRSSGSATGGTASACSRAPSSIS